VGQRTLAFLIVNDNWPQFRGPNGDGHSLANGLPLTWSETSNVKWKTAIHGKGWSSPVVWGNQVWLTTATEDGREMFGICIDRNSGKIVYDQLLFSNPKPEPLGNDVNAYASPTPVIEEGKVYLHFGSYGTACIDTKSLRTLWSRRDLPCRHYRGPSSSPILFENLLIITLDGADLQYVVALNKKTGETVWKTDRSADWNDLDDRGKPTMDGDLRKAHSTPIISSVDGEPVMVSAGAKAMYGYDPRTGRELWKINHKGYSASMRPVVGNGMAYMTSGYGGADLCAVKLGGAGDVTNTHIAWKFRKMVPSKPSPLLVKELLYLLNDSGVVTCVDAASGEQVWQERIGGHFSASPLLADGRIYVFSEEGKTTVLKPGRKFEALAESQLSDGFMASAAVTGKSFILRTKSSLYRIE
jgi:outer membrane protein assembly factor BamB